MFTGLIQRTGELIDVERDAAAGRLSVRVGEWAPEPAHGDSIAVQGVCLTLTRRADGAYSFDILEETFRKTNLGDKKPGARLNLERALCFGDPMGGHIVNGHVDGVGAVASLQQVEGGDRIVQVACSKELLADIVPKGSIACDGVSLTVVDVLSDGFTVHIIPHTWDNTSFAGWVEGDRVNLETDVLAKYARAALREEGGGAMELSWETLARLRRSP